MQYLVVEATSNEEAIKKAAVKVGDLVRVTRVTASSAGGGKFSVMLEVEPVAA